MASKCWNFISLAIIFSWSWTCPRSPKCLDLNRSKFLTLNSSGGQYSSQSTPLRPSTQQERKMCLLISRHNQKNSQHLLTYASRSPTSGFKSMEMKPKWLSRTYPLEVLVDIWASALCNYTLKHLWIYQLKIFRRHGGSRLWPSGIHPQQPFIHLLSFSSDEELPVELKLFYWYLFNLYEVAIEFPTAKMPLINGRIIQGEAMYKHGGELLSRFKPLGGWKNIFKE